MTASETEALLLEQSLIKKSRPPYNIVLRDDKSYPYIYLTDHVYPRLAFHRGAKRKTGRYFGPFPSASAVRESINILQTAVSAAAMRRQLLQESIAPVSAAPDRSLQRAVRASRRAGDVRGRRAPRGDVSRRAQRRDPRGIQDRDGEAAADKLEFERAAKFRDQITQLRKIQEQQYVHAASGDVDVFAVALASGAACVQGMFIRGGRLLGHRTWFPRNELAVEGAELLDAFLAQYYFGGGEREIPKAIVLSHPIDDAELIEEALREQAGHRVEITSGVRSQRARWLDMAQQNAKLSLDSYLADKQNVLARFVDLQEALGTRRSTGTTRVFRHQSLERRSDRCIVRRVRQQRTAEVRLSSLQHRRRRGR